MNIELDVHTHTVMSGHAFSTLQEMAKAAAEKYQASWNHGTCSGNTGLLRFHLFPESSRSAQKNVWH